MSSICVKFFETNAGLLSSHVHHCVVPENIHTPTTEGIGHSGGVGGSKTQEILEGRGVG